MKGRNYEDCLAPVPRLKAHNLERHKQRTSRESSKKHTKYNSPLICEYRTMTPMGTIWRKNKSTGSKTAEGRGNCNTKDEIAFIPQKNSMRLTHILMTLTHGSIGTKLDWNANAMEEITSKIVRYPQSKRDSDNVLARHRSQRLVQQHGVENGRW